MPSDAKNPPLGSMSAEELAEKLEKSEAGRKKLRQAISILQEKLDSTEKVLKINETLRQESERERQRAEEEKKKAEEEKRLRIVLEKESATCKEQLVKVLQRLGAVENRQKSDKKEIDRLRAEVKLAVEGARAAAQAVDAVQNSIQCLESALLEKVKEAVQRVDAVSKEVSAVQSSLQSLGNKVSAKTELVSKPVLYKESGNQLQGSVEKKSVIFKLNSRPEKLVDNITSLFLKEKKSHHKIEQKLAALKGLLQRSRNDEFLSNNSVDFTSRNMQSSRKRADKLEKKRSMQDVDLASSKPRKKRKQTQEDEIQKHFLGKNNERGEKIRSKIDMAKMSGMSENLEFSLQGTSKTHLVCITNKEHVEDTFWELEGLAKGSCDDRQVSPGEYPKMIKVDCHKKLLAGKEGLKIGSNVEESTRSVHFKEVVIEASEENLDFDSSGSELELDWLSEEKILLSPNLPEISSPVCDSPCLMMDSSVNVIHARVAPEVTLGQDALRSDEAVLNRVPRVACIAMPNGIGDTGFQDLEPCVKYNKERTPVPRSDSLSQVGRVTNGEVMPVTETRDKIASDTDVSRSNGSMERDCNHIKGKETRGSHQSNQAECLIQTTSTCMAWDRDDGIAREEHTFESFTEAIPGSNCVSASKSDICSLSGRTGDQDQHVNEEFGFEAVDSNIIKEMTNFLEDLPSISCLSANEIPSSLSRVSFEILMSEDDDLKFCGSGYPNPKETVGNNITASVNDVSIKDLGNQGGNTKCDNGTELPIVSDRSNILAANMGSQLTAKSSSQLDAKQSSSVIISLLQGFDLHIIEGETNLAMTAFVAINVKKYLSFPGLNSEQAELQRALVSLRTNSKLPIEYIACGFISSIVDMVSLETKGECSSRKAKSFSFLLQTFTALIESVFIEGATAIVDIMFTQLSRFLNEGNMIFVSFQGIEGLSEEIFVSAGLIQCNSLFSCRTSRANLEDAHAGSKVLAGLCQVLSCVSHLQTVVYEVLGCCDKDTAWLLTIFSSFASICGHTFFMLGPDDLLGHTICAIISELVSIADWDNVKGFDIIDQALKCSADVFQMPEEWEAFKGSPRIERNTSLEAALLSVLVALCHILFLTNEYLLSGSQLVLRDKFLGTDEKFGQLSSRQEIGTALPDIQQTNPAGASNEVEEPDAAVEQKSSHQDIDKSLYPQNLVKEHSEKVKKRQDNMCLTREQTKPEIWDWKKWKRKYCEVIGSLELIALYMGWEWTYNDLIIGHLWRMVVSSSKKISVAVISHVIGILGRFGVDSERKELPGLEELKRCLVSVLHSKVTTATTSEKYYFSSISQAAAAHALLKLHNASRIKRNISYKSDDMASLTLDPNVQNGNNPTSVNMEYVKEWLHDSGIKSQEALPNILKDESTISKLLPP